MPYLAGYATPQDYGATGNGVTDDTTAVQAAFTALQSTGGTLFVPAGTYLVSSVITCTGTVNVIGAGPGVSVFHQSSTTANAITYNATAALAGVSITGISLTGPGSGSGIGLLLEGNGGAAQVNGANVGNIVVSGFGSHGVSVINATGCTFESIFTSSLGGNALLLTGGSGNTATAISGGPISTTSATLIYGVNNAPWSRDANGVVSAMISPSENSFSPTNCLGETISRVEINSATQAIGATTGTVYMVGLWLPAGLKVTNLNWITGTTAAGTPTHWWLGLSNSSGLQLAHTADQTTGAIAANTLITKALTGVFTTTYTGLHYCLLSVTATTNPTSTGLVAPTNANLTSPLLAGVSPSAAQSTPGTDGTTTYTVPATAGGIPYMYLT